MHTYTVELRIIGDISGERDISSRLGMSATSFFQKGESKSPTRQWEKSVWAFAIEPSNGQKEWDSLEKGLKNLVDRFLPLKFAINELKGRYEVFICCGQFASGFGAGANFSPELLKQLAALEVQLNISTYWREESSAGGH